jgi:hypothetical protein
MIVLVAQYAVLAYYLFKIEKPLVFVPAKSIGMIFPLISLILCWLAARNIRKDEELVRSVDRIR